MSRRLATLLLCVGAVARGFAADAATAVKGLAPVAVSSANYRTTSREELYQAVDGANAAVNPETPGLKPLTKPQHFVFMTGEVFESDLTYDQVTAILTPALAKKGYINAADPKGIIREPEKVTTVLRVTYGTRFWRLPTVRSKDITWNDGMVARPRGRGLHNLGGESVWDQRAGGNDDVFAAMAANEANTQSFGSSGGGGGGAPTGGVGTGVSGTIPGAMATAQGISEYGSTREFHLIVVDAFDYQELKKQGKYAKRLWSTFVSAPQQRKEKFSEMAETLARNAIAYFGETSRGLQVYTDVRAEVKIGDLVVKEDADKK